MIPGPPRPLRPALGIDPLNAEGRAALARALPDVPSTVIPGHLVRQGLGLVYVHGRPEQFDAAIVQDPWSPTEAMALGDNPEAIWQLLSRIPAWDCVAVSRRMATPVADVIEHETGLESQLYGDWFYVLDHEPLSHVHPRVRLLDLRDRELVERSDAAVQGGGYRDVRTMLTEGVAAAGVVEGKVVALAVMSAFSEKYADVGVHTLPSWRNQGMAAAAASLVASRVRERGRIPVWSTGEDNLPSQRVAAKLGFREYGRERYVLIPKLRGDGFAPRKS